MSGQALALTRTEWRVVGLLAAVMFVTMLDGVLLLPLGPALSAALHIPPSHMGLLNAASVGAACVSGLLASPLLDRVDRRLALVVAMGGLFLGTLAAAWAGDFASLMACRVVAGAFGGPAAAMVLAIVSDNVAVQRRGRAMGVVSNAFSLASILGVPLTLQLTLWGSWSRPFVVVGVLGLLATLGAWWWLPSQRPLLAPGDLGWAQALRDCRRVALRPLYAAALGVVAINIVASGLLLPNLGTYLIANLQVPQQEVAGLWIVGGLTGALGGWWGGRLSDRHGSHRVLVAAASAGAVSIAVLFWVYRPGWPLWPAMAAFMLATMARAVVVGTEMSKVPEAAERGRFLALSATAQNGATALASAAGAAVLVVAPDGRLLHMGWVALVAVGTTLSVPWLMRGLGRRWGGPRWPQAWG